MHLQRLFIRAMCLALCLMWATQAPVAQAEIETGAEPSMLHSVNEVERGSLLLRNGQDRAFLSAPLLDTEVAINITAMIARVTVRQTFRHVGLDPVNGVYVFPLPEGSAVERLRMHIGERVIEGQIKPRAGARKIFEAARSAGRKATLVEQQRPNLFTTSVANIGPQESVTVEIEYQQTLAYEAGWFSLRFPLTVGVRYIPGTKKVTGFDGGGWSYNTNAVPDASSITPPVGAAGEGHNNPVTIDINLNPGMPLAGIESLYHPVITSEPGPQRYRVSLDDGPTAADRDFVLRFKPAAGHAPRAAFFRQELNGETYGLMMLIPPQADWSRNARPPRELVLVVDTSGSMHGTSITQARATLRFALARLSPSDTFNIIQFNSGTESFALTALPASPAHLARAAAYIDALHADGGTEMAGALRTALDARSENERIRQVIFVTDGSVGNEAELFKIIDRRLGASRLFTVGIGSAPNSYFMSEAAHIGRGTFTYIGDVAEVQEKIAALVQKLEFPVLADIRVRGASADFASSPNPLPDLYVHEPLLVNLRLGDEQALEIDGLLAGKPWSTRVRITNGGQAAGLDVAWARARIAGLERSLARGANREEVTSAITALGLKHHLITRHTSLVAVDVTPAPLRAAQARDGHVPNKMPAGWQMSAPAARLPQTATPLALHGLCSLFLGLGAWWARRRALRS